MAKRRNRTAPFESRLSRRSQSASGWQAPETSTGPPDPRSIPPGAVSQSVTRSSRQSSPRYWRLPSATFSSGALVEPVAGQPVRAGQALLDLEQPDPGAVGALGFLDPDDPVVPGERLLGVREPVGVVAVVDVVVAEEGRDLVGREGAGGGRLVGALPVARGARAVQDRQAEDLERRQRHVALGRLGVVDVGDRALHRVVGLAPRVGRDRVHPGDALVAALDPVVLARPSERGCSPGSG